MSCCGCVASLCHDRTCRRLLFSRCGSVLCGDAAVRGGAGARRGGGRARSRVGRRRDRGDARRTASIAPALALRRADVRHDRDRFVEALIARVQAADPAAAPFVHWGATSQDLTDTALVLCLGRAHDLLVDRPRRLLDALRRLSDAHRDTVMLARTLLQPAAPITFGLKAAGWFAAVARSCAACSRGVSRGARSSSSAAPSGTLAALGTHGLAVAQGLARELGLALPDAPWHAHRDRLAALVAACGVYTGSLGKIARDVALLMQFEVGEAAEPGGGSSSMPHKRNPAGCAVVLAAATRTPGLVSAFLAGMTQEHERGVGGWHAEGRPSRRSCRDCGSALAAAADLADGLTVDPDRMRRNLADTRGVIFAERAMTPAGARARPRAGAARGGRRARAASGGRETFAAALGSDPAAAAALGDRRADARQPRSTTWAAPRRSGAGCSAKRKRDKRRCRC